MSKTVNGSISGGEGERWQGSHMGERERFATLRPPEAQIRLVSFSLRFDELETRGAFVGGRAGGSALGGLAAVNEDILIALESADASFKMVNIFGIKDMSGVTGTMGYSDEEMGGWVSQMYQWEKEHDRLDA